MGCRVAPSKPVLRYHLCLCLNVVLARCVADMKFIAASYRHSGDDRQIFLWECTIGPYHWPLDICQPSLYLQLMYSDLRLARGHTRDLRSPVNFGRRYARA
ncbi:hypothetical protein EV421DRAFT_170591 [Armillaria borealis]|uniref:Secreted protein n=1 Tax=Armillaria borealis TaxID=47425 RepID=A0AA39MF10_9AGAR|nr:hypothetical protein EV421DRAFT_170591 [Armillaria borealis]